MSLVPVYGQDCPCNPASETDKTEWGWMSSLNIEDACGSIIKGVVNNIAHKPMPDVLVEIYDHPEIIAKVSYHDRVRSTTLQHRVAACRTDDRGRFCFDKLPPGKYEMRCSKAGYNAECFITLEIVEKSTDIIEIPLTLSIVD
jgi:hypothetical protein